MSESTLLPRLLQMSLLLTQPHSPFFVCHIRFHSVYTPDFLTGSRDFHRNGKGKGSVREKAGERCGVIVCQLQ